MTNKSGWPRRDVVKATGAAATMAAFMAPIAKAFGKTGGTAEPAAAPIKAVLVDPRYADSRAFAAALEVQGAKVFSVEDDLGHLWRGELGALFAAGGARVAGLTPHSDLFLSQSLARETGAKAACGFEGWHDCRGSDTLRHTLEGGAATRGLAAALDAAGPAWATSLAERVAGAAAVGKPTVADASSGNAPRPADHPGTLISWVIG
jgi:hypothetical protein